MRTEALFQTKKGLKALDANAPDFALKAFLPYRFSKQSAHPDALLRMQMAVGWQADAKARLTPDKQLLAIILNHFILKSQNQLFSDGFSEKTLINAMCREKIFKTIYQKTQFPRLNEKQLTQLAEMHLIIQSVRAEDFQGKDRLLHSAYSDWLKRCDQSEGEILEKAHLFNKTHAFSKVYLEIQSLLDKHDTETVEVVQLEYLDAAKEKFSQLKSIEKELILLKNIRSELTDQFEYWELLLKNAFLKRTHKLSEIIKAEIDHNNMVMEGIKLRLDKKQISLHEDVHGFVSHLEEKRVFARTEDIENFDQEFEKAYQFYHGHMPVEVAFLVNQLSPAWDEEIRKIVSSALPIRIDKRYQCVTFQGKSNERALLLECFDGRWIITQRITLSAMKIGDDFQAVREGRLTALAKRSDMPHWHGKETPFLSCQLQFELKKIDNNNFTLLPIAWEPDKKKGCHLYLNPLLNPSLIQAVFTFGFERGYWVNQHYVIPSDPRFILKLFNPILIREGSDNILLSPLAKTVMAERLKTRSLPSDLFSMLCYSLIFRTEHGIGVERGQHALLKDFLKVGRVNEKTYACEKFRALASDPAMIETLILMDLYYAEYPNDIFTHEVIEDLTHSLGEAQAFLKHFPASGVENLKHLAQHFLKVLKCHEIVFSQLEEGAFLSHFEACLLAYQQNMPQTIDAAFQAFRDMLLNIKNRTKQVLFDKLLALLPEEKHDPLFQWMRTEEPPLPALLDALHLQPILRKDIHHACQHLKKDYQHLKNSLDCPNWETELKQLMALSIVSSLRADYESKLPPKIRFMLDQAGHEIKYFLNAFSSNVFVLNESGFGFDKSKQGLIAKTFDKDHFDAHLFKSEGDWYLQTTMRSYYADWYSPSGEVFTVGFLDAQHFKIVSHAVPEESDARAQGKKMKALKKMLSKSKIALCEIEMTMKIVELKESVFTMMPVPSVCSLRFHNALKPSPLAIKTLESGYPFS